MAFLENLDLVKEMVDQNYIYCQHHPEAPLLLWSYSKSAQMDKVWNPATCACRGIITTEDYQIVARPFGKFWNIEEITDKTQIPDEDFEIFEKLDGSLGILYWIGDEPWITTKGSFTSEQGAHATKILRSRYSEAVAKLDRSKTYLFEIIWPEDHHCVQYGDLDDIFLIAVRDTETGEEYDIRNYSSSFKIPKIYDGVKDYHGIREIFSGENREGFVVKFKSGYRLKMKYESYFRIHFLKSMLSEKIIFAFILAEEEDKALETMKELDEENQICFMKIYEDLKSEYSRVESESIKIAQRLVDTYGNWPKDTRPSDGLLGEIKSSEYSDILFNILKGKPYKNSILRWQKHKRNL
jgi:RNA ligase